MKKIKHPTQKARKKKRCLWKIDLIKGESKL